MPDPDPPDLFTAAGLVLENDRLKSQPISRQKRASRPTPAQLAAADRLMGGRRLRAPHAAGQRTRVGQPRDLSPTPVLAFPLARNASVVAEVIERLPHGYARDLDTICGQEAKRLAKRLQRKGMTQKSARECANDLLHEAYTIRVRDAHREAGVL